MVMKKEEIGNYIKTNNVTLKPHGIEMVSSIELKKFKKFQDKLKNKKTFWDTMFDKKHLKKPSMVAILYLRINGTAERIIVEPKNEEFHIEGKTYHQRKDCKFIITKDRIPLAIIPEEGLVPLGNKKYNDMNNQILCQQHQDMAIKAIRHAEIVKMGWDDKIKKPINTKLLIVIGIIIIVGIALWQGGTFA